MSNVRYCIYCGASINPYAVYCHMCGKKQETWVSADDSGAETAASQEITVDDGENGRPSEDISSESFAEDAMEEKLPSNDSRDENEPDSKEAYTTSELNAPGQENLECSELKEEESEIESQTDKVTAIPAMQQTQPAESADLDSAKQAKPIQSVAQTVPMEQENESKVKNRKFPWFFTGFWSVLLVSVALWGFYLYYLYVGGYDYPEFTRDAQRIVLFVSAVFVLIYTLSLKLLMKKFGVLPTIILVLASLAILYFYCLVELQEGNFLHDFVKDMTERIIPAFRMEQ